MAKPPEQAKDQSTSSQSIWGPQGEALTQLYQQSGDWLSNNSGAIQDASNQQQNLSQGAINAVAPAWGQQLQGGTLAGYDVAGGLNNMIGQNNDVNAQQIKATMGNANTIGPVTQSWGADVYDNRVGPGGSLANMEGMYRNQANSARDDMLGSMDARAAASGMGGGSAHGNAVGRGMEGINSNLQSQMAQTGYDAYNRDLDRQLGIAKYTDQFNQDRAIGDQAALNKFGQLNQAAQNTAAQQNQSADLSAQQGNQTFTQQQQSLMSGLLDQQNQNISGAIGQQEDVSNYIGAPLQGLMNSAAGLQFLQSIIGGPQSLTEQQSTSNGATAGGGGNYSIGSSGANVSF